MSSSNNGPTTTPSSTNNNGVAAANTNTKTSEGNEQQLEFQEIDTNNIHTIDEALSALSKLQTMKDTLLEEKKRNDSYMKRYTEKVAKCERMATLHQLIPRQLFVREEAYQRELEKVEKWSGISDQEIADIYRRKLSDASNSNSKFKHHGAASTRDPYAGFREIPDFSKVNNGKSVFDPSSTSNNVLRNLDMMRRISSTLAVKEVNTN
jgi:hypothetical protein